MTWLASLAKRTGNEHGAALVMVAIWLPLLVLMAGFAIGVADWFAHKRHLQMQADAAALAGGDAFSIGGTCDKNAIKAAATQYSGVTSGGSLWNAQLKPSTNVVFDDNPPSPYQPSLNADPCADGYVDVNLKDTDPGSFFLDVMPTIRAHARVTLYKQTAGGGGVPISVPGSNPKSARVFVVDESNSNQALYSAAMTCHPDPTTKSCAADPDTGLINWDSADNPMGFNPATVPSGHRIGVSVVLSDSNTAPSTCANDVHDVCYQKVSYIDTWKRTPAGTATAPQLRGVTLNPASTCPAYYSTGTATAPCSVTVAAKVDFGADPTTISAKVTADLGTQTKVPLTYSASTGLWTSSPIAVDAEVGALPLTLNWTDSSCKSKCTAFSTAQRTFAAGNSPTDPNNAGGPIRALQLSELQTVNGTQTEVPDANSFELCSTGCNVHNLIVRLQIGTLELSKAGSKPVTLRASVNGNSGSQSLDCDPGVNVFTELWLGCNKAYQINDGTPCSTPTTPFPSCVGVTSAGGDKVGQIRQGINKRVFGTTTPTAADCAAHPNNFPTTPSPGIPSIPAGDTRAVQIFVTPLGSFKNNSTNDPVPIQNFAGFYLAGWDGDPCTPPNGTDPAAGQSEIKGYFIQYVNHMNLGGGTQLCDGSSTSLTPCVAVLNQ